MGKFSEKEMGIAFEQTFNTVPFLKFDSIFREVQSVQGIPDYVGVKFVKGSTYKLNLANMPKVEEEYLSSASLIISLVKKNSYRTEQYLFNKTGLSPKTIKKTVRFLVNKNILESDETGKKYCLAKNFKIPDVEICAFELKLHDWRRAVYQALRYKAFANYSILVFPEERRNVLISNIEFLKSLNLGVYLFDMKTKKVEVLVRPKKQQPTSNIYTLYMQGQLMNKFSKRDRVINIPKG